MKTINLLLSFFFSIQFATAQLPYLVTFEDGDPNSGTYIADANLVCGSTDYFGRVDDFDINGVGSSTAADFAGEIGTHYWAGESHDDIINGSPGTCGSNAGQTTKNIIFGPINISSVSAVNVSAMYAARTGTNWEGTEGMSMSYSFDNSSYNTGVFFAPVTTPDLEIREGGVEAGTALSLNFAIFTFDVFTGTNTQLWLKYTSTNESSSEELAIDQVQVSEAILPVELLSFEGQKKENKIELKWQTASELNNETFVVERSQRGDKFVSIGDIPGKGTTAEKQQYLFIDKEPFIGYNYYRLKQVDFDGQIEYSKVISLNFRKLYGEFGEFYPNPSKSGLVNLDYTFMNNEKVIVSVFDLTGRLILSQTILIPSGINNLSFDFSSLNSGVYIAQLGDVTNYSYRKLIIK